MDTNEGKDARGASHLHAELGGLQRWEDFRAEMQDMEGRLAKLASNFLELKAYEDAAKCALKAEGMRWVLGRMPPPNDTLGGDGK